MPTRRGRRKPSPRGLACARGEIILTAGEQRMRPFTTRLVIMGTRGVGAAGHYLAARRALCGGFAINARAIEMAVAPAKPKNASE